MPSLETWQKIILIHGANAESSLRCQWNLVEKVNAKKIELMSIASLLESKICQTINFVIKPLSIF